MSPGRGARAAPLAVGIVVAAVAFTAVQVAGGDGEGEGTPAPRSPSSAPTGRAVFDRMGCGSCHRLAAAGSRGEIGPDLDTRLPNHTRATLTDQIVNPAMGEEFGAMPDDFGKRMSRRELTALVDFLLASRGNPEGDE